MRRRLLAAIAGVAALAVTLFAIPLGLALQRSYRDDELLRLQRDTVAATRAIDVGRPAGDPIELPLSPSGLAVYDVSGRRIAGLGPARADRVTAAAMREQRPTARSGDGRLEVAVPLVVGERVTGVVRARRSDARVVQRVHRAWAALAGLALAVLALATGAAFFLARRLAGPLERLAGAARRLGDGDFGARAPRAGVRELDEVGAALDATAARLDELVTRERAFSADASHQLRTPLAALRLELEALAMRDDEPAAELQTALAQVDRVQQTIDTLLSVARDTQASAATTDLRPLLDAAELRWRGALAADGRPLRVRLETREPVAQAAPGVVDEILDVLLANAHRHGAGAVTATVRETAGWLALEVADEGPGFELAPEVSFARRAGSSGGHGIGLALARSLAHAEGGRVDIVDPGPHPVVRLLIRSGVADRTERPAEPRSQ